MNNDNQFDYSSNGASNQVGQKMIFLVKIANRFSSNGIVGQVEQIKENISSHDGWWVFSRIRHLLKLDKQKWHPTYLPTHLSIVAFKYRYL